MVPLLHLLGFPESHSPPVASDIDISTNCTANIRLKHGPEIVAAGHQDVAMKEEGAAITTQCDVRKTVGTIFPAKEAACSLQEHKALDENSPGLRKATSWIRLRPD